MCVAVVMVAPGILLQTLVFICFNLITNQNLNQDLLILKELLVKL